MSIYHFRLLFLLGIINIPNALGIQELQLIVIGLYILVSFLNIEKIKSMFVSCTKNSLFLISFLYLAMLIVSLFRAEEFSLYRALTFISFNLFLFAFLANLPKDEFLNKPVQVFKSNFSDPFIWYFAINLLCWMLNIQTFTKQSSEVLIGKGVILANFGIYIDRVNFLFSAGINSYAVILGTILTFHLAYCALIKKVTFLDYVFLFVVLFSLLLVDSRSGIVYPLLIVFLVLILWKLHVKRYIVFTPLLFFIIPLIFIFLLPELAEFEFIHDLTRSSADLFTLNGRLYIWIFTLNEFSSFDWLHLIGYGFNGHYTCGASIRWSSLFTSWENSESMHPHNVIFSTLFDSGYIGVSIFLSLFFIVSFHLQNLVEKIGSAGLIFSSCFIYIIFISCSETFIGLYYMNAISVFLTFLFFLVFLIKPLAKVE